MIAVTPNEL